MANLGPVPPGGDVNRGGSIIALQAVTVSVAVILIALRLYVRARIVHALAWDDFFIVLALVSGYFS